MSQRDLATTRGSSADRISPRPELVPRRRPRPGPSGRDYPDLPITVPTTFITGERDPVQQLSGPDPFQAMRDTVPGLDEIHIVGEAGHFVQLEAAEQVNDIMLAFLSRFG